MKLRIEIPISPEDFYSVIACLEIEGRKINRRSVREYLKTHLKQAALDSMCRIDMPYRDPAYKFWEYYQEAKEKIKDLI